MLNEFNSICRESSIQFNHYFFKTTWVYEDENENKQCYEGSAARARWPDFE